MGEWGEGAGRFLTLFIQVASGSPSVILKYKHDCKDYPPAIFPMLFLYISPPALLRVYVLSNGYSTQTPTPPPPPLKKS